MTEFAIDVVVTVGVVSAVLITTFHENLPWLSNPQIWKRFWISALTILVGSIVVWVVV